MIACIALAAGAFVLGGVIVALVLRWSDVLRNLGNDEPGGRH